MNVGEKVSQQMMYRILDKGELKECPRKMPFTGLAIWRKNLKFAKDHIEKYDEFWKEILGFDEIKIELFVHNDMSHVQRKSGEAHLKMNCF